MFKSVKKLILIVVVLVGISFAMNFVLASSVDVGLSYGANTGLSDTDPREIAANIIRITLAFLGILAVVIIMYGGFLWMTAGGDEGRIDTAKKLLVSAVIGLVIILSAFAIATFVLNSILDATGPDPPGPPDPPDPPGPTVSCDGDAMIPGCQADDGSCNTSMGYFCNSSCQCVSGGGTGDPCGGVTSTPVCDVAGSLCGANFYCNDLLDCTCQPKSNLYEDCNATSTIGFCEPNQNICNFDLTCDSGDCKCKDFPIIKGISPSGGFCDDEPNKICADDSDCTLTPSSICNITTPNTAIGNIITISGSYFGSTTGAVLFWDGSGFTIPGLSPSNINPNCDSNWEDGQIIVVVPTGVVNGPVLVRRADAQEDTTDNTQGPLINDLLINNITKPGLCKIDPAEGLLGDNIDYHGINFTPAGGDIRFGSYSIFVAGQSTNFVNDTDGSTIVPNINPGRTTSFVVDNLGGESNLLRFNKLPEKIRGAFIVSFSPQAGASSQYVTIYGSGFKNFKGTSQVYFGDENTGVEADYNFPDVCADSVWNDNQVIIKVPENSFINDGNYVITMVIDNEVIDTSTLATSTFNVDNNLLLAPSLCKISPTMGQAGNPISLWGEYFDSFDGDSAVRFYLNREMQTTDIIFWDLDPEDKSGLEVYKIETTVHDLAVTGPVEVAKASPQIIGNSIDFGVGSCLDAQSPDDACGVGNICCPVGTFKAGRCDIDITACNDPGIPTSVYEWEFSTSPSTVDPDTVFTSCAEKSKLIGTCDVDICPNSAGSCSFYDSSQGASKEVFGDCSFPCKSGECFLGSCTYDPNLDKCLDNNQTTCSLASTTDDILNSSVQAFCDNYNGAGHFVYINNNLDCSTNWIKALGTSANTQGTSLCVDENSSCTLCQDNFVCMDDNDFDPDGVCADTLDICPGNSVCESDDKCRSIEEDTCDCCCRIAFEDQDCCIGLTCAGECGSDKNVDTDTYGSCSGCRIESSPGVVDQIASDEACNCSIAVGKYCDADADVNGDGIPEGACRDCGQLVDDDSCSDHSATCCVDAMNNDRCMGGTGNFNMVNNGIGYCEYFECSNNNTTCNIFPVATPGTNNSFFDNVTECQAECQPAPVLGLSCVAEIANTCDTSSCAAPFGCIDVNGNLPAQTGCGTCCCDPNWITNPLLTEDPCSTINLDLSCRKDQSPCGGDDRGLCCGCTDNNSCGNASQAGCGNDTCCRARPDVSNSTPADNAIEICANAEIRVEFNQKMSANSFSGNIIVVGEYNGVCPEGTDYLALKGKGFEDKNIFIRIYYKIVNKLRGPIMKLLGKNVLASPSPVPGMNYCAIRGFVDSQQNGADSTILRFLPLNLLDAGRKYFVIIRGDVALNNGSGVLSFWDIGMNIAPAQGPVDNTAAFNGIVYNSAYIWSFTTLEAQVNNPLGICDVDHVDVAPSSYLFNKILNDLNENDTNINDVTFDTEADKDKKFISYAVSSNGQILTSVSSYSWDWTWAIDDGSVISTTSVFQVDESSQLIEANDGITDKATKLHAEINIINTSYSNSGDGEIGTADIQVFICENPWPPIQPNGTWSPWIDTNTNCTAGVGSCLNTNYLLYYCRDSGAFGTQDDLPAILSDAVTRRATPEILKESFFFREDVPSIQGSTFTGQLVATGGAADFDWQEILDPNGVETVVSYKIYYGTESGFSFDDYISTSSISAPYQAGNSLFRLTGLDNNTDYYFAITAVYENGSESEYSNEVSLTITDTAPPSPPMNITASSTNASIIEVFWTGPDPSAAGYIVRYGHTSGNPGERVPINVNELISSETASFNVSGQQDTYYIIVTAVDEYGNESANSQEVLITF